MDELVEALILSPFRDIVLKAKTAGENAWAAGGTGDDAKELVQAARALQREGERALSKIEPLCRRQLAACGQTFIDALRDDDGIAAHRTQLNDLLWEFDDYLELGSFDRDKFTELQALSRGCAPKIIDILIRMKLDSAPQAPLMPATPPAAEANVAAAVQSEVHTSNAARPGPGLGFKGGHSLSNGDPVEAKSRKDSVYSNLSASIEEPPPFPEKSPWQLGLRVQEKVHDLEGADAHEDVVRRPGVPPTPPMDSLPEGHPDLPSPRSSGVYEPSRPQDIPSPLSPLQVTRRSLGVRQDGGSALQGAHSQFSFTMSGAAGGAGSAAMPSPHLSDSSYSEYRYSSLSEARTDSSSELASPATTSYRTSGVSAPDSGCSFPQIPEEGQPGLEHVESPPVIDSGLIPVDAERSIKAPEALPRRRADCSIGPDSSFRQMKGFCEGAKEVLRGGVGVKQVRKLNYGYGAVLAAKCRNCLYELDWNDVEADVNGQASANYVSKSTKIGFRLRFLSKSHLPARALEDQVYACLFCVQQGHTTDEGDATVFFSQKQLFRHIARHPRPLPAVPGIKVTEGGDGTPGGPGGPSTGHDLHLPSAASSPLPESDEPGADELAALPTARATETVRQAIGTLKTPPDKSLPPLQFAVGARIIGVEFPSRYGGEWAWGYSDHTKGIFPASAIKLEPPTRNEIIMSQQGASNMRAVARWKFAAKDKDRGDWLRLEKGDVISNIAWSYPGHWCWSGTNPKGKWGIFPQSHIDTSTLREGPKAIDRASVGSHESKVSSLLARISIRARVGSAAAGIGGGPDAQGPRMHIQ